MRLTTRDACREYVEDELRRLLRTRPSWSIGPFGVHPAPMLSWSIGRDGGWYTLEARLDQGEFLIWFGNHQVGAGGLHWIMRPAVHVAFEDLAPRDDEVALPYTLCDVLDNMIASLGVPAQLVPRFEPNMVSLT